MPKWVIVLLIIALIGMLGCGCGFAACHFMCSAVGNAARTAGDQFRVEAEAAAKRAQTEMKRQGIESNAAGVSLPANLPSDIPIYSGFKPVAKVEPPGTQNATVTLEGTDSARKVADYYKDALTKKGWKQNIANEDEGNITQNYVKGDEALTLIISKGDTSTTLTMMYTKQ